MKPKGNLPVCIVLLLLLFLLPHESESQRPFRGRRRQRQRARKLGAAAAAVGGGGAAVAAGAEGRIPARRVPGSRGRGRLNSAATTEAPAPFYDYYDYDYYDLPTAPRQPQRPLRPSRPIAQQEPAPEVVTEKTKTKSETVEEDYDISELVAAWKDYIKEKKENEQKPEEPKRGTPTDKRRPLPAATLEESAPVRQQAAPAPAFAGTSPGAVEYDYYGDYDYYYDTRRPAFHRPRRPNRPRFRGGNRFSSPGARPSAFGGSAPGVFDLSADYQDLAPERPVSTSASRAPKNEYECEPQEEDSYRIPDEEQCDKFFECNIKGQLKEKLCPDGLVFDIKSENCDYPAKVNCTGRPTLQPAQPSKNCPRANGFFPFPSEESCQKFWDCREGRSYLQTCPAGVIFDNHVDACVTPDQAGRKDCTAIMFLGFECPTYGPEDVLRFGNHDRLPDPKDCQQFFSCLKTGEPRLGACPRKTVFNNATGHCGDPKSVKGCETYWEDKLKNGTEYDYYEY